MKKMAAILLFLTSACATNLKILTDNSSWKEYATPNSMGAVTFPRCMATDQALHVFGGFREGASVASNSQGYSFDFATVKWTKWPGDQGPQPRQGSATALTPKGIFVFGGEEENEKPSNDAFLFSSETMQWQHLPKAEGLAARSGASATAIGDDVIVFGGKGPAKSLNAGVFDLASMQWSDLPLPEGLKNRVSHVAIASGDRYLIWGGFEDGKRRNDGFLYDLQLKVWKALPPTDILSPRANAKVAVVGSKVYILGGMTDQGAAHDGAVLDLASQEWSSLPWIRDEGFDDLHGFELVAVKDSGLFLSGGRHANADFNKQSFFYDFKSAGWKKVAALNPPPGSIAHCLSTNAKGTVFVLGGLGNVGDTPHLTQFSGLWFLRVE